MSTCLQSDGLQHARPSYPSPTPRVCSYIYMLKFTKTNCSWQSKSSSGGFKHSVDSIVPKYLHQRVQLLLSGKLLPSGEDRFLMLPTKLFPILYKIIIKLFISFSFSLFFFKGNNYCIESSLEGSYNCNTYICQYLYLSIFRYTCF